jgi:hypothetical protein
MTQQPGQGSLCTFLPALAFVPSSSFQAVTRDESIVIRQVNSLWKEATKLDPPVPRWVDL